MEVVLLIARLFLAFVFGVAGIAKAADLKGSRRAFVDFGIPERLAVPLAWLLPSVEILIAIALVPLITAWWGAIAAFALLLFFIVGISVNLARGRSPDCRCFGQLHSEPVGWATLARNLLLAAVGGFIVVEGKNATGLSALSWLSDLRTAEAVTLLLGICMIGLLAYAIIFMKRMMNEQTKLFGEIEAIKSALNEDGEFAQVIRQDVFLPQEGLPIGATAPKFSLAAADGDRISLDDLLGDGKSVLLLFAGPNCWGCKLLLPAARAWQRDFADLLTVAVLTSSTPEETNAKMARYEIENLLLDTGAKIADKYQARWTPAAVLIHPDGKIASHAMFGDNAIREWVRNLIASDQLAARSNNGGGSNGQVPQVSLRYSVRNIGEPAPDFSLPDLSGKMVGLEDLLGSPTLLLLWYPHCEFCNEMAVDLKSWEDDPPRGSPKLVFIATGKEQDVRAMNESFKSLTLHDRRFEMALLFGTKFTPSAILIDGEGRIASSLAMGEHNVRALIGLPQAESQLASMA